MEPGDQRRSRAVAPITRPGQGDCGASGSTPASRSRLRVRAIGSPAVARQRLRVAVSDERGGPVAVAAGLGRWLVKVAPARAQGSVSVALVSDALVRALNRRYRGLDCATDVLSFRVSSESPGLVFRPRSRRVRATGLQLDTPIRSLGDIVIARGVAERQARAAGHSCRTELRVLALHGLLHLLGYDHERDGGTMERVERRLRVKGGLPAGLVERGLGTPRSIDVSGAPERRRRLGATRSRVKVSALVPPARLAPGMEWPKPGLRASKK